jgi:hypothetical protein
MTLAALLAALTLAFPSALLASPFCCGQYGPGCRMGAASASADFRIETPTPSCCQQILPGDNPARAGLLELRAPGPAPAIPSVVLPLLADLRPGLRHAEAPEVARPGPSASPPLSRAPPLA